MDGLMDGQMVHHQTNCTLILTSAKVDGSSQVEMKFHCNVGRVVAMAMVFGVRAVSSVRLVDEIRQAVTLSALLLVQHLPAANRKSETPIKATVVVVIMCIDR